MMKRIIYLLSLCTLILSCEKDENSTYTFTNIKQISPELITAGTEVTITGEDLNFNPTLIFDNKTIPTSSVTNTKITFTMPEDASSGVLKIQFDDPDTNSEAYLRIEDTEWDVKQVRNYNTIRFISTSTGFASINSNINEGNPLSEIYKTTNGGETWTTVFSKPVNQFHYTIVNENVIYAKSKNFNNYYKTINGGTTWEQITTIDVSYSITKLFFKNESEGFLLANKSGNTYIFKTTNGGISWEENLVFTDIDTTKIKLVYQNNNEIKLINTKSNTLIHTIDYGINWTTKNLNIQVEYRIKDSQFSDNQNAWLSLSPRIGMSGGLFSTDNVNDGWEFIETPERLLQTNDQITKIIFINELKGYLTTEKGGHLYTEDGGETWQLFYLDFNTINAIDSFGDKVYIVADSKLYIKEIN